MNKVLSRALAETDQRATPHVNPGSGAAPEQVFEVVAGEMYQISEVGRLDSFE